MKKVEELKNKALALMQSAGFPIAQEITIAVDKALPIMGYTTEKNGKPFIVVSQWAQESDMLMGLIIHELSHIYRMQTHHPSHNAALQNKAVSIALGNTELLPYQREIMHAIINSIMDLYADDIFFSVFTHNTPDLTDFFLSWVHAPIKETSEKSRWTNAGYLVSAAFAQANLERHSAQAPAGRVAKAIRDFLDQGSPAASKKFQYFKELMMHLPENITDREIETLLEAYIRNFLQITNIRVR